MIKVFFKKPKVKLLFLKLILLFSLSPEALSKDIEIGLITSESPIIISSNQEAALINLYNNKIISKINKGENFNVTNVRSLVKVLHAKTDTSLGAFTGPVKLVPEDKNGLVFCNNRWYRGELIIFTNGSKIKLTAVNKVDIEDYLISVIPSEIPYKWHKESIKALSVAARSYALGYLNRRRSKGYDLEATVEDQVYLGVSSEKNTTSEAVKETKGKILLDADNRPLIALYHSSGGGYTDSIENIWDIKPSIHIQPRPDYDDNSPHFQWYRNYKPEEVNNLLSILNIGDINEITPLSRSESQRIKWIRVAGTKGKVKIRGEVFRRYLKLPSSKFNLTIEDNQLKVAGRGYGHGLGLSQWGSKHLAEEGFTYDLILSHYYPEAKLVNYED